MIACLSVASVPGGVPVPPDGVDDWEPPGWFTLTLMCNSLISTGIGEHWRIDEQVGAFQTNQLGGGGGVINSK